MNFHLSCQIHHHGAKQFCKLLNVVTNFTKKSNARKIFGIKLMEWTYSPLPSHPYKYSKRWSMQINVTRFKLPMELRNKPTMTLKKTTRKYTILLMNVKNNYKDIGVSCKLSFRFVIKAKAWEEWASKVFWDSNMLPQVWEKSPNILQWSFHFESWSPIMFWMFETTLQITNNFQMKLSLNH
jgi:hypothetical protein